MAQFARAGQWQRVDGEAMRVQDWESPDSAGFRYVSADADWPAGFIVDRAGRQVELMGAA